MDEDMEAPPNHPDLQEDPNMQQKIINEEYKIWKKNAMSLYDTLYARANEWPTLTVQWFPDVKQVQNQRLWEHRILYGTNTADGAQNYVHIAALEIPRVWDKEVAAEKYNESMKEIGGYGVAKEPFLFREVQKICHPSEVNKARYMWQNPNIIGTMAGASEGEPGRVLIFDRTKHPIQPTDDTVKPELELEGHKAEGYAMSWSWKNEGALVTGASDNMVKTWDCRGSFKKDSNVIAPVHEWRHHSASVNDVQHHPVHYFWIGSVSDDKSFQIVDTRQKSQDAAAFKVTDAHDDAVNCLAFHPKHDVLAATGSSDHTVAMWDLRNLKEKVASFEGHRDIVNKLEWHPTWASMLGSSSNDRRIIIWDISRVGMEQSEEEAEDGPPELLFMHGGFTDVVTDFSWNRNDPWLMCGAAEDNQMQVFRPARAIVEQGVREQVLNRELEE